MSPFPESNQSSLRENLQLILLIIMVISICVAVLVVLCVYRAVMKGSDPQSRACLSGVDPLGEDLRTGIAHDIRNSPSNCTRADDSNAKDSVESPMVVENGCHGEQGPDDGIRFPVALPLTGSALDCPGGYARVALGDQDRDRDRYDVVDAP